MRYFRMPSRFEKLSVQGRKPAGVASLSPSCSVAGKLAARSGLIISTHDEWHPRKTSNISNVIYVSVGDDDKI